MEQIIEEKGDDETAFLKQLLAEFIPSRFKNLIRSPTVPAALQLLVIGVFTAVVGAGYGYGLLKDLVSPS
jgi:hypothetical protein